MKIREFTEKYNKIATNSLKNSFLNENIKVKTYIPYLTKVTLADKLAKITMSDSKTANVKINSSANYLLFLHIIIEQYTDLEIETDGFYEEYDLLNEFGLIDKIMQLIPEKEIAELKMLCDFSKNDFLANQYETHAFISSQVTRFGELIGVTLKPVLEKLTEQLENMDEDKIDKIGKMFDRAFKKINK